MEETIETLAQKAERYKIGGQHMVDTIKKIEMKLDHMLPDRFDFRHGIVAYESNVATSRHEGYGSAICYVEEWGCYDCEEETCVAYNYSLVDKQWDEAGAEYCLHGDFHCLVENATRFQVKRVAEEMPAFIEALAAHLSKWCSEMEEATAVLEKMLAAVEE